MKTWLLIQRTPKQSSVVPYEICWHVIASVRNFKAELKFYAHSWNVLLISANDYY